MKNIDKIRKMSRKELARFLVNVTGDYVCEVCVHNNSCRLGSGFEDNGCYRGVKKWLGQEVKE